MSEKTGKASHWAPREEKRDLKTGVPWGTQEEEQ
jgi:hypothetical protein